jgi:hypothetical protein
VVRYLDPVAVQRLVVPQGDTARARARSLLTSVYEAETLAFEAVDEVTVLDRSYQVPVATGRTTRGAWEKLTPTAERSMFTLDAPAAAPGDWIDLVLATSVAVRVSERGPVLESFTSEPVAAGGVAEHAREYHLQYAEPAPYLPDDPAVRRTYPLRVCALFFASAELVPALRRVIAARREVDARPGVPRLTRGRGRHLGCRLDRRLRRGVRARTRPGRGLSRDDVARLLAAEGVVAAFETTP